MSTAIRSRLRHYGVAIGAVILAVLLTLPLQGLLTSPLYALFYAAVAVSSWYGGAGSGLVATGLSTLAINYFFTEPPLSLHISSLGEIIRLGAFVLVTLLISSLNLELRTAKSRIEVSLRKLRDSEERYRCLVDTAYEGIWTTDAAGRINYVNQRMAQMLGYSIEEMRDRFIFEFMDAEARQEQVQHFKQCQPLMKEQFDFRYRCKDGSDLWAIISTSPILDDGNNLSGVLATVTDISARKQAEAEAEALEHEKIARVEAEARTQVLRETNHRITRILESITDAFISLDTEWRFTYVNGQAEQLIGKPRTALIGQIIWEVFPAIHDSQYYTQIHRAVAEQVTVAYEEFYPTLNRWFAIRLYPSADGVSTYLLDISDRIQEEALREQAAILENQQKWLEEMLNFLPLPLLLIEPGTARVTFANRAAEAMAGGEFPKNVPGEDYHTVYYCTDATGQRIPDDQMPGVRVARGEHLEGFEMDWQTPLGVRSILEVGDTLPPMYGHPATCVLVFQDITERKRVEQALEIRLQQQAVVAQLSQRALAGIELSTLMDEATTFVAQSLDVEYCKVLELLLDGHSLLLRAGVGWNPGLVGSATVGSEIHSQAGYTLLSDHPVIVENLLTETRFSGPPLLHDHKVVSGMSVVIQGRNKPFGVFGVHTTRKRTFIQDDINFLQTVANVLATAIERKQAEEALRESQDLFQSFMNYSPVTAFIKDEEGRYIYVNALVERLLNKSFADLVGKTDFDIFPPETARQVRENDQVVLSSGKAIELLETVPYEEGDRSYLSLKFPLQDAAGRKLVAGMSLDITDRQQLEDELRQSEARFRRLVESNIIGICFPDLEGNILDANDAFLQMVGYTREELHRGEINWRAMSPPEYRELDDRKVEELRAFGICTPFEKEYIRKDGSRIPILVGAALLEESEQDTVAFIIDLSDRKRAESELRESEAKIRRLIESNIIGVIVAEMNGVVLEANDAFLEMVGYTREDLHSGNVRWREMTPPEYRQVSDRSIEELRTTGVCTPFEKEYIRKDGSRVSVLIGSAFLDGTPQAVIGFVLNLTERKRAESALRESEARFRQMADSAPILIWMSNPDKLGNYFNKGWLNFTGRTLEQELGNGWSEAVHPDDLQRCLDTYTLAFDKRQEFTMEYRLRRFDGEYRWIFDIGTPRFTPDGTFLGYIGSCVDINERKQAEEEIVKLNQSHNRRIKELETLLEVIPIGIGIAEDERCHYIRANPPLAQLLRISPQVNASLSAPDCEKPPFKVYRNGRELKVDELPMQYAAAHGVEVPNQEMEIVYENGDSTQLLASVAPLFDEESQPRGCIAAFLDITERKLSEAKIRQLNEQLEQRVKERTAQLEAANQELESFSYSVSHDLRAPLRHIDGFVNLLQKRAGATLDETSQRYLNTITQTVKQAGMMIDHLLALSRVGRTQMRWAAIDMNQLVKEIQRELKMDTDGRVVHWQIAELPQVEGDVSLLRLAVRNLLENALKYTRTRPQGEIVIDSTSTEHEILFFVRDNGVGFDMRYVHKLFGVFQRLHSEQDFEGNGIGLANVQRIIHRHGGRTWAEGAVDQGATFYFALPKGVRRGDV